VLVYTNERGRVCRSIQKTIGLLHSKNGNDVNANRGSEKRQVEGWRGGKARNSAFDL